MNNLKDKDLGLTEFQDVWRKMQVSTDQKSGQEKDEIWFTEHHPVYTLGHAAIEENIISTDDIPNVLSKLSKLDEFVKNQDKDI